MPERIVPGHGPVGDASSVSVMQEYFPSLRAAAAAGQAEGPMPGAYADWEAPSLFAANIKVVSEHGRNASR